MPDKVSLPAWSPWTFDGPYRAGPRETCALALDYDGGVTLQTLRERWAPWCHVGHTSWSHESEADARARVVLPLARPLDVDRWPRLWAWALQRDPTIDVQCGDAGRLFFLPFVHAERPYAAWQHEGPLLDVDRLQLPEASCPAHRDGSALRCDRSRPGWRDASADARRRGDELRNDPGARYQLARQLDARFRGEGSTQRAVAVRCPGCREPSVWFWVAPRAMRGARCVHQKSCGWTGWLDELEVG